MEQTKAPETSKNRVFEGGWEYTGMVGWLKDWDAFDVVFMFDVRSLIIAEKVLKIDNNEEEILKKLNIDSANADNYPVEAIEYDYLGRRSPSEILPGFLFHGGAYNTYNNEKKLKGLRIEYIVNATSEYDNAFPTKFKYCHVNVYDFESADIFSYFHQAADFISEAKTKGVGVLVHCAAGISRSTSIVLAYLMKYEKMSLKEAFILVKARRKGVSPNRGFVEQLLRFEKEIYGTNSVADAHEFYMLK